MITSEIIINKIRIDAMTSTALNFNEIELHNTIDNVFKNVGDKRTIEKRTCWYYIKTFMCFTKN
mgnify:CR=1 FL=1